MARLIPFVLVTLFGCTGDDDGGPGKGRLPDDDRDGYTTDVDCDDQDPAVHPDLADPCNGADDDCDGAIDEDPEVGWYPDTDQDGFGDGAAEPMASCGEPTGTVASHTDCDDGDPARFPGNDEACDGLDNDCDGAVDEDVTGVTTFWWDGDGDGAGDPDAPVEACVAPEGAVANPYDCDDTDPGDPIFVSPGGLDTAAGRVSSPIGRIQTGLERSHGCVVVGPGTYTENLVWPAERLVVWAPEGPGATQIRGAGDGPVVLFYDGSGDGSVLDGFTLSGGTGWYVGYTASGLEGGELWEYVYDYWFGGAVFVFGTSPTLRNLHLTDSHLPPTTYTEDLAGFTRTYQNSYGGGLYVESGAPTLEDIVVSDTYSSSGGGVFLSSGADVTATRLALLGTEAEYGNLTVTGATLEVENLLLNATRSEAGWGGVVITSARFHAHNATIVDTSVAVANWGSGDLLLADSILVGNLYGVYHHDDGYSSIQLTYNNVYGSDVLDYYGVTDPTGVDGNISASPKFTAWNAGDGDATNDDLTLTRSSPCLDAGDPARTDVDGTRGDMGMWGGPEGSGW